MKKGVVIVIVVVIVVVVILAVTMKGDGKKEAGSGTTHPETQLTPEETEKMKEGQTEEQKAIEEAMRQAGAKPK